MKLHIENIAKIEKADIDIEGITVIVGSNNTGKSTIGKVLYTMVDAFYNIDKFVKDWKPRDAKKILNKHGSNLDFICKRLSGLKRRKIALVDDIQNRYAYFLADAEGVDEIKEWMHRYSLEHLNLYGVMEKFDDAEVQYWFAEACDDIIQNMMDYDSDYAKRYGMKKTFTEILGTQICKETKKCEETNEKKHAVVEVEINNKKSEQYRKKNTVKLENNEVIGVNQEYMVDTRALYIENPRVLDLFPELGYEKDEKEIQRKIAQWLKPDMKADSIRRIPFRRSILENSKIDEEIKDAESNAEMQRMDELITEINNKLVELMKGTVDFSDGRALLDFNDNDYVENFKLASLSTGLKAISLLQCILHYRALKQKSVLILDEPEVNLHPEWQVKYADYIAILQSRLNLHVVVTTHSPFFLKAIENASIKNGIENKCHYYYASNKNGDAILQCVDNDIEKVYSKMMMPLFEMIEDMGL